MKHSFSHKYILLSLLLLLLLLAGCAVTPTSVETLQTDALAPLLSGSPLSGAIETLDAAAALRDETIRRIEEEAAEPEPVVAEPAMLTAVDFSALAASPLYEAPGPVPEASLVPDSLRVEYALANAGTFPSDLHLESYQTFLYCVNTGEMVGIKGWGEDIYPASVTKLLTILTALQVLDPEDEVTPGSEIHQVSQNSSIAYLSTAYTLSVAQLVEAMMIPSGNDASYALSVAYARKALNDPELSISDCMTYMVEQMNEMAESLGMTSSHFSTVDGYMAADHVTTIEDMARLAVAAYNCPSIRSCCGTWTVTETLLSGHQITWQNSNYMLDPEGVFYDSRITGMKTGSLTGNNCMIVSFEEDGITYLAGIFGCYDKNGRYRDALELLDLVFPDATEEVEP